MGRALPWARHGVRKRRCRLPTEGGAFRGGVVQRCRRPQTVTATAGDRQVAARIPARHTHPESPAAYPESPNLNSPAGTRPFFPDSPVERPPIPQSQSPNPNPAIPGGFRLGWNRGADFSMICVLGGGAERWPVGRWFGSTVGPVWRAARRGGLVLRGEMGWRGIQVIRWFGASRQSVLQSWRPIHRSPARQPAPARRARPGRSTTTAARPKGLSMA